MIRNVIFDFGKVLVGYDYVSLLRDICPSAEAADDFLHRLTTGGWTERIDLENEPIAQTVADMQQAMPQHAETVRRFWTRYTEFVTGEVKGMRALLVRLRAEGYRLFGLSNWCSKVNDTMRQYPIFQLLDGRVLSSEEHLAKPDLAIYRRTCRKLGIEAAECVFVDDREENVAAARACGMQAVRFTGADALGGELSAIVAREGGVPARIIRQI